MQAKSEPTFLKQATDCLVKAYQPKAIYLFGSHARGTAGPDSDYDLLLVVDDNADKAKRKSEIAYRILRPLGQAVDVLVWRQSRFLEEIKSKTSLPYTINQEGLILYAA
jgi:predicted nucleotidyltransferase